MTLVATHENDEVVNGVVIKALAKRPSAIMRILLNLPAILFFTLRNNFDIYHAHDPELIPVLFILQLCGKKVVFDMHENFPKQLQSKRLPKIAKAAISYIWPKFEGVALRNMNVVFAETSYKDDYPYIKSSVDILNMPLVAELKKIDGVKHDRFTLGYVGDISEDRYCIKILEVLLKLQNNGVDVGFECVGPISCKSLEGRIKEFCLMLPNVHFYGSLPPAEAWKKIAKCHVGVAVLMPKPNYVRSYPTKLFEYLAMGMPVVTSNFELYKPIVIDEYVGFCVDPLKPEEFERAVLELYYESGLLKTMSKNTENIFGGRYNWDNELQKLRSFYERII